MSKTFFKWGFRKEKMYQLLQLYESLSGLLVVVLDIPTVRAGETLRSLKTTTNKPNTLDDGSENLTRFNATDILMK